MAGTSRGITTPFNGLKLDLTSHHRRRIGLIELNKKRRKLSQSSWIKCCSTSDRVVVIRHRKSTKKQDEWPVFRKNVGDSSRRFPNHLAPALPFASSR